jgi:hypothetical protein
VLERSKVYARGDAYLLCRTPDSLIRDGVHVVHPAELFAGGR